MAMTPNIDETIDEIRAIRTAISSKFSNDVRQLASYYQQLEQRSASVVGSDHEVFAEENQTRLAEA